MLGKVCQLKEFARNTFCVFPQNKSHKSLNSSITDLTPVAVYKQSIFSFHVLLKIGKMSRKRKRNEVTLIFDSRELKANLKCDNDLELDEEMVRWPMMMKDMKQKSRVA